MASFRTQSWFRAASLSLLFCSTPSLLQGEVICSLGSTASYNAYQDERPSADAMQLAAQVNAALSPICRPNCPVIAVFRNATAPNVMLVATGSEAKIVYAPQFFTSIYETAGDGAILAMIAHELGHALSETAPMPWIKRTWPAEMQADAWAGCALAKGNLSARALRETLGVLAKFPVPADPGWNARTQAIRAGYLQCGGDSARFRDVPRP